MALSNLSGSGIGVTPPGFATFRESVRGMPAEGLSTLYDGLWNAAEALAGGFNRPACTEITGERTAAGKLLDTLHEDLFDKLEIIVSEARQSKPADELDRHARALLLLKWEIVCGAEMYEIAAFAAAEAAVDKH